MQSSGIAQFFPSVLIFLDLCAAAGYLIVDLDFRRTIYWIAAAFLTACVTV